MTFNYYARGRSIITVLLFICRFWPGVKPYLEDKTPASVVAALDAICAAVGDIRNMRRPGPG